MRRPGAQSVPAPARPTGPGAFGFAVLGLLWLGLGIGVAPGAGRAWPLGVVLAVGTLWYLVPGTVISALVLVLLLTPPVRRALGRG